VDSPPITPTSPAPGAADARCGVLRSLRHAFACLLGGAALLAAAGGGCRRAPVVGADCDPSSNEATCGDARTLLRCDAAPGKAGGVVRAYPCRGPKGCANAECDASLAEERDACRTPAGSEPSVACDASRTSKLRCIEGKFVHLEHCRGPAGCDPATRRCDSSLGVVGDACTSEGHATCSADGKRVLYCRDGKEAKGEWCRGPGGCEMRDAGGGYTCDQSAGVVGEGCTTTGDSCSVDGARVIWCERGRFSLRKECGTKKCVSEPTTGDISRAECR
jgi:hypothetical protein